MFQFGRFSSLLIAKMSGLEPRQVSPFGYLRLLRPYTPHRSFSQYNTSFFGTRCLGIHCVPFVAFRTIVRSARLSWHALLGITFALIILLLTCTRLIASQPQEYGFCQLQKIMSRGILGIFQQIYARRRDSNFCARAVSPA